MKFLSVFRVRVALLTLLFFAGTAMLALYAQGTTLPPLPKPGDGFSAYVPWAEIFYGAFVVVAGYLSSAIPFFKQIPDKAWRIAAIAIVGATIFIIAGWANAIPIFISYLIATKAYELFLKPSKLLVTPDTASDVARKEKQLEISKNLPAAK